MKKLINKLSVFVLALTLSFGAVFSTACKLTDDSGSTSTGGQEEPAAPTNTKREEKYTFAALGNAYGEETVADMMFKNGAKAPLKDYMLGDAFNEALKAMSSSIATTSESFNPSVDIDVSKWFGYDYFTDGHWYSRSDGKQVHEVLDMILSYELDGSKPLDINDDIIAEYANDALITVMPSMKMLVQMDTSGMLARVFNIKIGEIAGLLSGDKAEIEKSVKSILGDLSVKEIASSFGLVIDENAPKMVVAAGELKLSYIYDLSAMDEVALTAEAKKFLTPFKVEDLFDVFGATVDETAPKMIKEISAITFTELFDAFEGEDGGAAFVQTMLDKYTVNDVLEIFGYEIEETSSKLLQNLSTKKLSEVLEILTSSSEEKEAYFLKFAQTYTLGDLLSAFGNGIDETSPVMLRELKDKTLGELLAVSSKDMDEAKAALIALYGKYTVKDLYEAMGMTAPEGSETTTLETIINDLFSLATFDGTVAVVEKYIGEYTVGAFYSTFGVPVKADMAEVAFKTLSQQAKAAADEYCPAEKPEGMTDEEYLGLQNTKVNVYASTFAQLVFDCVDFDAIKTFVGTQIEAVLNEICGSEILPGITVNEVIAALGDEAATKALVKKAMAALGVEIADDEFETAYGLYIAPVITQLNKTFNEDVIVGEYTISSFVLALVDNTTREEALKKLTNEIDAANGDFTATTTHANLVKSFTDLGNTALGSVLGATMQYVFPIEISFELGGVDYKFQVQDVVSFVLSVVGGAGESELEGNEFYKAISQMKVKDLIEKAEEIIDKIIASIPSEPSEPDVPSEPEIPSEPEQPEKPSGDKNGVDLPIIPLK